MKKVTISKLLSIVMALVMTGSLSVLAVPLHAAAAGTTYYVDSVLGSDNNSGTSPDTPWQTLDKVNATTFSPGETIALKRGSTWTGFLYPKGSGTADASITIDAYGDAGLSLPRIDGNGKIYSADDWVDAAVYLKNQSYWTIRNLEITNNAEVWGDRAGIHIDGSYYGSDMKGFLIENNIIHDVASNGDANDHARIGAITLWARSWDQAIADAIVQNNTIYNTGSTGIYINGERYTGPATGVKFLNNYLYNIGGDGILMAGTVDGLTEYNVVNNSHYKSTKYCVAIWAFDAIRTLFQYNEAYNTKTTTDGQGLDSDYQSEHTTFQYNYSHDNQGGFILICSDATYQGNPAFNRYSVVRYNIGQNNANGQFFISGRISDTLIYNNTIYIRPGMNARVVKEGAIGGLNPINTKFFNNIFYNMGTGGYIHLDGSTTTYDYNLFYGRNSLNEPADPHKLTVDPQIINPGGASVGLASCDAYKISAVSPVIGAGKLIAGSCDKDFFGNPVSATVRPNIGADNNYNPASSLPEPTTTVPPTYGAEKIVTIGDFETAVLFSQFGAGPKEIFALSGEMVNPNTSSTKALKVSFVPNSTTGLDLRTTSAIFRNTYPTMIATGMRLWMNFKEGPATAANIRLTSSYTIPGMSNSISCNGVKPDADGWVTANFANFNINNGGANSSVMDATKAELDLFLRGITEIQINMPATGGIRTTVYLDDLQLF
ncbi:MAG: hypothetical protein BGN88_14980, partial [Clostridiales bacterium 43-6]